MGFGEAIKTCFSKYVDFSGRARRSEFWWFVLAFMIGSIIPFLNILVVLGGLIPYIAVYVRRLHDTGRSGWWMLLPIVPMIPAGILFALGIGDGNNVNTVLAGIGGVLYLVGLGLSILLLVWLASDSQPGPNRFGPSPKETPMAQPMHRR